MAPNWDDQPFCIVRSLFKFVFCNYVVNVIEQQPLPLEAYSGGCHRWFGQKHHCFQAPSPSQNRRFSKPNCWSNSEAPRKNNYHKIEKLWTLYAKFDGLEKFWPSENYVERTVFEFQFSIQITPSVEEARQYFERKLEIKNGLQTKIRKFQKKGIRQILHLRSETYLCGLFFYGWIITWWEYFLASSRDASYANHEDKRDLTKN